MSISVSRVHVPEDWRFRAGLAMVAVMLGIGALWLQDAIDPRWRLLPSPERVRQESLL